MSVDEFRVRKRKRTAQLNSQHFVM